MTDRINPTIPPWLRVELQKEIRTLQSALQTDDFGTVANIVRMMDSHVQAEQSRRTPEPPERPRWFRK